MNVFLDDETSRYEPIRGLPERLPPGEAIRWQGSPDWRHLAVHAFHIRFIAGYFLLVTSWRLANLAAEGAPAGAMVFAAATSLLALVAASAIIGVIAWAMARAAIFTISDERIVMRYGGAIRKYVNLPYSKIAAADVRTYGKSGGDIALTTTGEGGPAYLHLWPFARPLKFTPPMPTLRGLASVDTAAQALAAAIEAQRRRAAAAETAPLAAVPPAMAEAGPVQPAVPLGAEKVGAEARQYIRIKSNRGAA
ncbi:MAG: photosynthetic complex putative assembly protein PuhB [Pseudomonadota bacterium]